MIKKSCLKFCISLFVGLASVAAGEEKADNEHVAGHSYHGEAFNEGPRRRPYSMPGLGQANFHISTSSTDAQRFFNQGVDQLHGFWYYEAERSFREVALLDPNCAIAYWGIAMANVNNKKRAAEFVSKAVQLSEREDNLITDREKLYIAALSELYDEQESDEKKRAGQLVKGLEKIVLQYPDDIEAKAFLACQIWMNQRKGIKIVSHVGINSILNDIFDHNPNHPAHHYCIHLWDYENAEIAVNSAEKCGPSLPGIAHMWHMPGHIFSKLKRYEDAVFQQEASARVDHAYMMRDRILPDQIHNFAHNNEWCIRNLNHIGRIEDAINLANNMLSLPRHPKYNDDKKRGSYQYGRQRLIQTLSNFEKWDLLIQACENDLNRESETRTNKIDRLRHLGRAFYRSQKNEQGNLVREKIDSIRTKIKTERAKKIAEIRLEQEKTTTTLTNFSRLPSNLVPIKFLRFVLNHIYEEIKRDQRKRTRKSIDKSTKSLDDELNVANRALDELVGYECLASGNFLESEKKLKAAGGVDAIFRSYVLFLGGKTDKAIDDAKKHVESRENEVQPQAMYCWLLWEAGKKDEAVAELRKLATISASIDHDDPFFEKLNPVIQFAGEEFAWQPKRSGSPEFASEIELDQLGPFRWAPVTAPTWQLSGVDDSKFDSNRLAGQPYILIFYLGHGCLHCAEQLQTFAPEADRFFEAGIEMIAISTDDQQGLQKLIDNYGDVPLPIRLYSDSSLSVFKTFHAFDEFEQQPLHATFLIDGNGKIRWQDISYEPFMDADFLLDESKRLLANEKEMTSAPLIDRIR